MDVERRRSRPMAVIAATLRTSHRFVPAACARSCAGPFRFARPRPNVCGLSAGFSPRFPLRRRPGSC
ncbi:hypothetical protein [Lysobacter gummosus]|uniref:hypothetical protein n=1 Tax=Lysobacter gummosus TaxID=262324 RepID=UPI0036333DD5